MESNNKILYIGAGTHLTPISHIYASEYVFIDTQPRSEFDELNWDYRFYKENFYSSLIINARQLRFTLCDIILLDPHYFNSLTLHVLKNSNQENNTSFEYLHLNPTLLVFQNLNTGQKLKYYISTNIQFNMCSKLHDDILNSNGLIISGYHPNNELFTYIKNPINLYCYTSTIYIYEDVNEESNDMNNIIYWCNNNLSSVSIYFNNIYIVHRKIGYIIKCNDFQHMLTILNIMKIN